MGRQQMVDTFFWEDPWVRTLTRDERYLYLYFLTTPLTNLAGVFELTDETIAHHTSLDSEEIPVIMEKFQKDGKVYRWGSYIIMRNWPKRQNIRSEKVQIGIERILGELPLELLEFLVKVDYKYIKTAAVYKLKVDTLRIVNENMSTGNPQEEPETGGNTVPIPYPNGIDTQSHFTSPHLTSPHSTERPLKQALDELRSSLLLGTKKDAP